MKINRVKSGRDEITQIYLSEEEHKNEDIQMQVRQIKEKNNNVVLFISGAEEMKKILEYIVNYSRLKKAV